MMRARSFASLAGVGMTLLSIGVQAQSLNVVETSPPDKATVDTLGEGVFVRFDKPVDHIRALLFIRHGDQTVATLHPRFKTEPNVLFAEAPALTAGDYILQWSVPDIGSSEVMKGQISFSLKAK